MDRYKLLVSEIPWKFSKKLSVGRGAYVLVLWINERKYFWNFSSLTSVWWEQDTSFLKPRNLSDILNEQAAYLI